LVAVDQPLDPIAKGRELRPDRVGLLVDRDDPALELVARRVRLRDPELEGGDLGADPIESVAHRITPPRLYEVTVIRPVVRSNSAVRPKSPPTASATSRMPARWSASRAATTLRSPIWMVPGGVSDVNMLAPPISRATIDGARAPRAIIRSTRAGTAV